MRDEVGMVGWRVVVALALLLGLAACGGERGDEEDLTSGAAATIVAA